MHTSNEANCQDEPISIILNSADRTSGSTFSDGSIVLKRPIRGCKKLAVISSVIPNTAYTLNGVTFTWTEQTGPTTLSFTITGSYTATALALYLQQRMIAVSLVSGNIWTYAVTYNVSTGKMLFRETTPHNFKIDANAVGFPVYRFGFGTTATGVATAYAASITSPYILDLSASKYAIVDLSGITQGGQVVTGGDREITGYFVLPMGTHSFEMSDYFQKSMYDSWVRVTKNEVLSSFRYRIFDAETKVLMPLQSNWSIQLRAE
jgi:hypothetical protein